MKKIYFIVNPAAGNGQCLKTWKLLEGILSKKNISYLAIFTEYPGHAKELAWQIASKSHSEEMILVAVGGDGTVHEMINGLIHFPDFNFGFIPGGSGNDFSRGFLIPSNPAEAAEMIIRLSSEPGVLIDVGKITMDEEYFFINNMGVGFDALISYEVNRSKAKRILNKLSLGRLVYVYFLLKKLAGYKRGNIQLEMEGKHYIFEDAWFVSVSNQPYYGGGMKIAPNASTVDGLFDITAVHKISKIKLLLVFISVFYGKHIYFKGVRTFRGKKVSIRSSIPLFVHADGEHIGQTPLTIELLPGAIRVLTKASETKDENLKDWGAESGL